MKITRDKSKLSDEWATPLWLYGTLNDEFSFDMDVCASDNNFKHKNYTTKEKDALSGMVWGLRNFCNPPYSNISPWYREWVRQRDIYCISTAGPVKYDPSTKHGKFAAEEMDEIRLLEHRIAFVGAESGANFPIAIMVCRPRLYTRKTGARVVYVDYRSIAT